MRSRSLAPNLKTHSAGHSCVKADNVEGAYLAFANRDGMHRVLVLENPLARLMTCHVGPSMLKIGLKSGIEESEILT